VSSCFAERPDLWEAPAGPDTTVTLMATEGPRLIIDQLARDPEGLAASLALAVGSVAHPKLVLAFDALVLLGPEHAHVFEAAGWTRAQLAERIFELTKRPAGELVRGAGGSPEGIDPQWVGDPAMPVQKFASAERIRIACAGGDAGLFSMVFGSWASGEIGSAPVTARVEDWL
jgi:hypothetical protein